MVGQETRRQDIIYDSNGREEEVDGHPVYTVATTVCHPPRLCRVQEPHYSMDLARGGGRGLGPLQHYS